MCDLRRWVRPNTHWERKTFSRFKTFQKILIGHHTRKSRNVMLKHTSAQTLPPAPASLARPTLARHMKADHYARVEKW